MPLIFAYLTLFLPLIASVFCFLVNFKKSDFLIFIGAIFALLILITKLSFDFQTSGQIINDAGLGVLSIPTEYRLDFLALFFLIAILIAKLFLGIFYQNDLSTSLNKDNRQLFYAVWLLNLFGGVGVFATNNIFNLFVFIEIYCLTLAAIMAMSDDINLSKLAFKYFCNSALGSILLIMALVLLYSSAGHLQIDQIEDALVLENSSPIFWLFAGAVWLKFFPAHLYFQILKSRDQLANFLVSFVFIINGLVGLYLLLRMILFLFEVDEAFFNLAALCGFALVFYGNYKILRVKYLRVFAAYFLLINLGFILITFFVEQSFLASLFYVSSYASSGLILFLLSGFLFKNYHSCNFKILTNQLSFKKMLVIGILILILLNLPLGIIFWANWNLALVALESSSGLLVLLPILTTNLALANLIVRLFNK